MTHEQHPGIGALTLAGRHLEAMIYAHKAYREDPKNLVMYASTCYSARKAERKEATERIEQILHELVDRVRIEFDAKNADALDVISTIFAWFGFKVKGCDAVLARLASHETVALGLELTQDEPNTKHTRTLLMLTLARIMFWTHNTRMGMVHLKEAARRAPHITDVNQRSRAMRNAGGLLALHGHLFSGIPLYLKARRVSGIAPDVKAKNKLF